MKHNYNFKFILLVYNLLQFLLNVFNRVKKKFNEENWWLKIRKVIIVLQNTSVDKNGIA